MLAAVLIALVVVACGGDESEPSGGPGGSTATGTGGQAGGVGAQGGTGAVGGSGGQGGQPAPQALIHRVGRFDDTNPDAPSFTWSGTSLRTRIEGTALDVELHGAGGVFFEVIVDDAPASVFETTGGAQSYPLVSGLSAGTHDVEIYRRNEGFFGAVEFLDFVPGSGSVLVESPRPYAHRIEFIGDSITCGYGVEGPDETCNFSGDTENAFITYAAIAARELQAEAHLIAYSGKGVYQNYGGDTNEPMPEMYLRTLTNDGQSSWDFSSWIPEAVVVNLGTNDFSVAIAQQDFVGAYVALLGQIRSFYPAATIFCVSWASWGAEHEGWVQEAMTQSGDDNLQTLSFASDPADGWGCDYHPSATTHQKLGAQLADAMGAELGW